MKYTTKKPTEVGAYWINDNMRTLHNDSRGLFYTPLCGHPVYVNDMRAGTRFCPIQYPEPVDKFEELCLNLQCAPLTGFTMDMIKQAFKAGQEAGE